MKNYAILFFVFGIFSTCYSQESKIVSKVKFNIQDSIKTDFRLIKQYHHLDSIDIFEITYLSDGLKIQSFAAIPQKEGKYPVIIFNRGGNRDFGALSFLKQKWKSSFAANISKIASSGYIVIGCNYRGGGKSEGSDEFGGKDVNDILNLIEVVKELPKANSDKIGMYGWSRGGMMTYLALTKSNQIKAAVIGAGRTDLTIIDRPKMETNVYAELIPDYWKNKETELKNRSALFFADKFPKNVPILLLHGNADWRVKSTNALQMALKFEEYRIPYRLKIFEGAGHGIREFRKEKEEEVISWFDRFLKNGEPLPKMDLKTIEK